MSAADWIRQAPSQDQAQTTTELRAGKPDRAAFSSMQRRPIRVVLDGVQHAYKIGTILRLCDAMLVGKLIVCGRSRETGSRNLTQAAQGKRHWVPYVAYTDATEAVLDCRADGDRIIVAEQTRNSVPPDLLAVGFPICLAMGPERNGVSKFVVALADATIVNSTLGMANSLNVSAAVATLLNHLTLAWCASTSVQCTVCAKA
jgi:tRNA G18 (ribose-2'-O)-methylase SpoU